MPDKQGPSLLKPQGTGLILRFDCFAFTPYKSGTASESKDTMVAILKRAITTE